MPAVAVSTTADKVVISLTQFQATLAERTELMRTIGAGQLVSIRHTFADSGSPAGSWAPLAESTKKKKGYTEGHKLLILSSRLLNSITFDADSSSVTLGTNVSYARVQQLGSGEGSVKVKARTGHLLLAHHYNLREVKSSDGKSHMVPTPSSTGKHRSIDKNGRTITVKAKFAGPRRLATFDVAAHERTGGIPARPYLVFRPEDPARILEETRLFAELKATEAGMSVN